MSPLLYAKVDREACIACGLCQMLAPDLFKYDKDGIASLSLDDNRGTTPLDDLATINFKIAYKRCPTGAIKRSDKPFSEES